MPDAPTIARVTPVIGMEIHVELATRTKMFSRVASPAAMPTGHDAPAEPEPNSLIDPVTLGLPGALPVPNAAAIDLSIRVGLALNCSIARTTKWDRKSYFYPDLPKGYQTSQYDLPLCYDGSVDVPRTNDDDEGESAFRVGIIRAHLEEDAGKLMHELPGGRPAPFSIVDLNRAGTPLLEIVTAPDLRSADEAVALAQWLRDVCRALGATRGVMQQGHMRFEPNINTILELEDGSTVTTPIVEVKNLNSFRAVRGAIDYELREQPRRWQQERREMGPGAKSTRGWDDDRQVTTPQREKEDAHDYRYFPCPDLLPVAIDEAHVERLRAQQPELPHYRSRRYRDELGLGPKEAAALVAEPATSDFAHEAISVAGPDHARTAANLILQTCFKLANERGVAPERLGVTPQQLAGVARLRDEGQVSAQAADQLVSALRDVDEDPAVAAERLGLVTVSDTGQLGAWVDEVLADPENAQSVEDLKAGKQAAIGRLIGGVMQKSGGQADAKAVRAMILEKLG